MKRPFTEAHKTKILQLEYFLQKNQYFSKDCLPGIADSMMFQIFQKEVPQRKTYPLLTYWYITIKQFAPHAIRKWKIKSENDQYFSEVLDSYRNFISKGSNPESEIQIYGDFTKIQHQYLINIKLKNDLREDLGCHRKKIENQNLDIISYEVQNDEVRIEFRCDENLSERIKREVSLWEDVSTFEIKKIKNKKTVRSKMHASDKVPIQQK